ncbi:hypothetical protein EXIGLDRAFT_123165 [Exidia glandulosa HHB12029]|uniref:F-box domain-containing protein n=1 Tax=Exidia glandulosa HHB12029 TaxID=1314781 RepID=A0A165NJ97_EXIGL|nr:hypothetical protein EXIGLDRAFT_123165 [Exidia glandulosa HHB12029]
MLRRQLDITLASTAQGLNPACSLQLRLPDELWCMIWQDLSLADRVSVSLVCHAWRTLALGCPRVWSSIDFDSDVHGKSCKCSDLGWLARRKCRQPKRVNFHLLDIALEHCKEAQLTLHSVDSVDYSIDLESVYREYFAKLQPYAGRIAAIRMDLDDCPAVLPFLNHIHTDSLPSLRILSLSCRRCPHDDYDYRCGDVLPSDNALPRLEELSLPPCSRWTRPWTSSPALRAVSCPIDNTDDILSILHACPALEILHLTFVQSVQSDSEDLETMACIHSAVALSEMLRHVRRLPDHPRFLFYPSAITTKILLRTGRSVHLSNTSTLQSTLP